MPTPQALEALKILASNRGSQVLPTEVYGFSGRIPTQGELESPFEQEQAARAAAADARDREAVSKIQATNAGVEEYNRPDVAAVRGEEEQNALRKLIMPIQAKGQYDVAAAQEHAKAAAANTNALIGGRQQVAETNQGGIAARQAANLKAQALQKRYASVATGKEKAPLSGISGFFGLGQQDAQQKLLADIQAQIDAATAEYNYPGEAPVQAGALPTSESPAARLARLRATMGR